eukprot:gene15590-18521_t
MSTTTKHRKRGDTSTRAQQPPARQEKQINYHWAHDMLNWGDGSYSAMTPLEMKVNAVVAFIIFAITMVIYARTQYPSVSGGDAGELIINAHQLGIAHPPGYPLFTMLANLFDRAIPLGTVAWRISIFSSFCGALCASSIYLTVKLWVNDYWCAITSALMFAFSPLIWCYHIQGEVFSLNNMFVAQLLLVAVLYVRVRIYENERFNGSFWTSERIAYLSAFICALGLTNQHTFVLVVVPFAFWLMFIGGRGQLWTVRNISNLSISAVAGLSPYLYLFLAPRVIRVKYAWGNTSSISGFVTHFLRQEYGTMQLYSGDSGSTTLMARMVLYFFNLFDQFTAIGVVFAVVGLLSLILGPNLKSFQWKSIGTMVIFTLLFYVTFFFNLCNLPIEKPLYKGVFLRFFMQPNVIISVAIGVGLKSVFNFINSKALKTFVLPLISIALCGYQIATNYQLMDQSENYSFVDYGHAVLDSLPKNALLLVGGDLITNVPQYLHLCEGVRPDVDILSMEEMSWPWFTPTQSPLYKNVNFPRSVYHPRRPEGYSMKEFLDSNQHRPIFLGGDFKSGDDTHHGHYFTVARGLTSHILPSHRSRKNLQTIAKEFERFPTFALPNDTVKYPEDSWEYFLISDVATAHERSVENLLSVYLKDDGTFKVSLSIALEFKQQLAQISSSVIQ